MTARSVHIASLFKDPEPMLRLCAEISPYGLYTSERVDHPINQGLSERHDVMAHYLRYGNRMGDGGAVKTLARRTNYFRGELAYGDRLQTGAGAILQHEALASAARKIHECDVVVPHIVFANVVVPGQELAPHTDVPELFGCNRKTMPQWLVVVMLRSGLFDESRLRIATGVSWLSSGEGGTFACWPDGVDAPAVEVEAAPNSAFVIDNCDVVHAVDRFGPLGAEVAPLRPGMQLDLSLDGQSVVTDPEGATVVRYSLDELRVALVWKAYCFEDAADLARWQRGDNQLTIDVVIDRIVQDLRVRGRITGLAPSSPELGLLMIDEYVRYPIPAVCAAA